MTVLAERYRDGHGVAKDDEQADYWDKQAAIAALPSIVVPARRTAH